MHIGGALVDVDPDNEVERDPSIGLEAMRPPQFPTGQEEEMVWLRDCQHAIERQAHEWAIAPRCEILAPRSGLRLQAGAEVVPGRDLTMGQIHTLHRRGVLLRGTPEGKRAAAGLVNQDARFVVAAGQQLSTLDGLLLGGAVVDATMLEGSEQSLLMLVHRGVVLDRYKPPVSQSPTEIALREREMELEQAKAAVQAAIDVLAERDDKATQKAYVEAKLALDLSGVRVEHARKAVEVAAAAEVQRQRLELARKIQDLEAQIKERDAETTRFRSAELGAAIKLADAFHASHAHEDGTFQLRIERNARFAELHGGDMREETMPGNRLHQQIYGLAQLADIDPKYLNGKK